MNLSLKTKNIHQKSSIWETTKDQVSITVETEKALKSVSLEGGIWMDATPENNTWSK